MSTNQRPSVGRVVHYVLENGAVRPAMIVEVADGPNENDICTLFIMTAGSRDGAAPTATMANVARSEAPEPGAWMWPPFVAPKP